MEAKKVAKAVTNKKRKNDRTNYESKRRKINLLKSSKARYLRGLFVKAVKSGSDTKTNRFKEIVSHVSKMWAKWIYHRNKAARLQSKYAKMMVAKKA